MTTYYVDPWNGSNASNGTSWATAWKWPPGNGTAINPGDEIRVAKSSTHVLLSNYDSSSASLSRTSVLGHEVWAAYNASPTVSGISGLSMLGSKLQIASGTVIPTNTKLVYWPIARTQTTLRSIEADVRTVGIPTGNTGQYLKIVLCSDSAGNTPIATLLGPTVRSDDSSSQTSESYVVFTHDAASTLNLTINSVALYSVAGWTAPAYAGYVYPVAMVFQQAPAATGHVQQGAFLQNTQKAPATVTMGKTFMDGSVYDVATSSGLLYMSPGPRYNVAPTYNVRTYTSHAPLPWLGTYQTMFEAPLAFSGTAGAPIVISGGWDTATNTRTGYTNLGFDKVISCLRKGAFVFSSGGQYVNFAGFLCCHCALVYYDYVVGTLNSVNVSDCVYGATPYMPTTLLGFSAGNTTLQITAAYVGSCTTVGLATASIGPAGYYNPSGGPIRFAAGNLTFGSLDIVDCYIYRPNAWTDRLRYSGTVSIRSSTPSTYLSLIATPQTEYLYLEPLSSSALLSIADTVVCLNTLILYSISEGGLSVTTISLTRLYSTDFGVSGSALGNTLEIAYAKVVTLDGWITRNSLITSGGRQIFRLTYSAGWWAANPTGVQFTVAGILGTGDSGATSYRAAIEIYYPPQVMDWSGYTYTAASGLSLPGIVLWGILPNSEFTGLRGSFIALESDSNTPAYYPNNYAARLYNCTGQVIAGDKLPLGTVKVFGGSITKAVPYAARLTDVSNNPGPMPLAVALYGVTFSANADEQVGTFTSRRYAKRRSLVVEATPTGTYMPSSVSGATPPQYATLHMADSAVLGGPTMFSNLSSFAQGNHRGILARKRNGAFLFKAGASIAYSDEALNEYGKHTIRMIGSFRLATIDVVEGTVVSLSVRVRAEAVGYFLLTVPPCTAYTAALNGHTVRKNLRDSTVDTVIVFSIAPQTSGVVYVNVFASVPTSIKDFSVAVV